MLSRVWARLACQSDISHTARETLSLSLFVCVQTTSFSIPYGTMWVSFSPSHFTFIASLCLFCRHVEAAAGVAATATAYAAAVAASTSTAAAAPATHKFVGTFLVCHMNFRLRVIGVRFEAVWHAAPCGTLKRNQRDELRNCTDKYIDKWYTI